MIHLQKFSVVVHSKTTFQIFLVVVTKGLRVQLSCRICAIEYVQCTHSVLFSTGFPWLYYLHLPSLTTRTFSIELHCFYHSIPNTFSNKIYHVWWKFGFSLLRGGGHHLISRGGGVRGWTKIFFHYDPADIYFFPAAWSSNYLFHFHFEMDLFSEGNYSFQRLAATNYLLYHLLALNYLFKK